MGHMRHGREKEAIGEEGEMGTAGVLRTKAWDMCVWKMHNKTHYLYANLKINFKKCS